MAIVLVLVKRRKFSQLKRVTETLLNYDNLFLVRKFHVVVCSHP